MATFQPSQGRRWVPCLDPNAPAAEHLVPQISCDAVTQKYAMFGHTGKFEAGYLLMLVQHITESAIQHSVSCPYNDQAKKSVLEHYYDSFMQVTA